jgi:hypothetical protein
MVNNIPRGTDPTPKLHPWKATTTASDYAAGGALIGTVVGCAGGALLMLEAAPVGCGVGGEAVSKVGLGIGLMIRALLGLYDSPGSDFFDWNPDQVYNPVG